MGGSVGVTIKKDGVLKKMARRTGSYNSLLFSKEALSGELDTALNNYYKIYDEMREDYLNNTDKFKMSSVYGWCNQMIPVEYGLVFIDYDTKEIHTLQGYDIPGSFLLLSLELDEYHNDKIDESILLKRELISQGLVNISIYDYKEGKHKSFSLTDFFNTNNPDQVLGFLTEYLKKRPNSNLKKIIKNYHNDMKPDILMSSYFYLTEWNIITYNDNVDGWISFFNNVKGYLNKDEIKGWVKYVEDLLVDYSDDEVEKMKLLDVDNDKIDCYIESKKMEYLSYLTLNIHDNKNKP